MAAPYCLVPWKSVSVITKETQGQFTVHLCSMRLGSQFLPRLFGLSQGCLEKSYCLVITYILFRYNISYIIYMYIAQYIGATCIYLRNAQIYIYALIKNAWVYISFCAVRAQNVFEEVCCKKQRNQSVPNTLYLPFDAFVTRHICRVSTSSTFHDLARHDLVCDIRRGCCLCTPLLKPLSLALSLSLSLSLSHFVQYNTKIV